MAAADDLLSTCGSLDCLQLKAEVVSAFCIIFGLNIATNKLRTYHVRWGNKNTDLLDHNRNPYRDATGGIDTMDYIINYSGQTSMNMSNEKVDAALARIETFPCMADLKKTALKRCVYMSMVYQLRYANWSLSVSIKLDQETSACIKRLAGMSQNYPSELLFVSGKYGGHNFARHSDAVQIAKLVILHSYQARLMVADNFNGYHTMIMSSLLGFFNTYLWLVNLRQQILQTTVQ